MGRYLMFGVHYFHLLIFGFYDGSLLTTLLLDIYNMWAMLPALSNRPTGGEGYGLVSGLDQYRQ
jgi:hypothetical protein